jgi:uncharacterized membrane protein YgcG
MKISVFSLLYLSACFFFSGALQSYTPDEIPNPLTYPRSCGRPRVEHSSICDIDNLLPDANKDVIEGHINAIVDKKLAQVGVVVIPEMHYNFVNQNRGVDHAAGVFARSIHDRWGVGQASDDKGLLVLLSIQDRIVYISRGKGVEYIMTDRVIDSLIDNMKQYLRSRDYGKALESCVLEIQLALSGESIHKAKQWYENGGMLNVKTEGTGSLQDFFIIVFVFAAIVTIIFSVQHCQQSSLVRGRRQLDDLMREVRYDPHGGLHDGDNDGAGGTNSNNTKSDKKKKNPNQYVGKSCPICLEDYPNVPATDHDHTNTNASDGKESEDNEKESANDDKRRPMLLRCGHAFCYDCLSKFLKSRDGKKCPICRADVGNDGSSGPSTQTRPPSSGTSSTTGTRGSSSSSANTSSNPSCSRTNASSTDTNDASNSYWTNVRAPEIRYRLDRMRVLYPDILPQTNYNSLLESTYLGRSRMLNDLETRRTAVNRMLTDMRTTSSAASSGRSGSSLGRSFGGGRSSGGRGGRW